ncbi:potassium channel family protein [Microbacterium sp. B2969]|uniref:Potassium channel family protein n=1 Tax=Microbacterium alkaliflavum TaxID=3248839 RepID=A0ABW7Q886_9MICO
MPRGPEAVRKWEEITYWPLIIASLLWLIAYSWKSITDAQGELAVVLWTIIGLTYVVFVVDYVVRLFLAKPRGVWFRGHLLDLAIVAIPMLRALRLLRAITSMTFGRHSAGTVLRSRIAIYGAGASLLVIYLCALAVLDVERGAPGANIENFGDAIWWAFVTVATVGYGDYYPVTALGRIWAVGLMAGGIAIVGTVTATVSSYVIEKAAAGRDDDEPATRGQVRGLAQEMTELSGYLKAAKSGEGTDAK